MGNSVNTQILKDNLQRSLDFNIKYAVELIRDIPEHLIHQGAGPGLENHPSFTLGHLVTALGLMIKYLGKDYEVPQGWDELFRRNGPGDPRLPETDGSKYPEISETMNLLRAKTEELKSLIASMSYEDLTKEVSWRFSAHFSTLADLLYFMCIQHSAMHLGQLAAWRRALGFSSALKNL